MAGEGYGRNQSKLVNFSASSVDDRFDVERTFLFLFGSFCPARARNEPECSALLVLHLMTRSNRLRLDPVEGPATIDPEVTPSRANSA
jgi:hypothetical protein